MFLTLLSFFSSFALLFSFVVGVFLCMCVCVALIKYLLKTCWHWHSAWVHGLWLDCFNFQKNKTESFYSISFHITVALRVFVVIVYFDYYFPMNNKMICLLHLIEPFGSNQLHRRHLSSQYFVRIFSILVRPLWMRLIHFRMFLLTSQWNWLREILDTKKAPLRD